MIGLGVCFRRRHILDVVQKNEFPIRNKLPRQHGAAGVLRTTNPERPTFMAKFLDYDLLLSSGIC
jgi:hypothetical protein